MTPLQIAQIVIEKLQEQNRVSVEALQKTQSDMRRLEKQLTEKEQLLKIMENKVRTGSNTYLEMGSKQKDIKIKNLELQVKKLLKDKEDLEHQVIMTRLDVCEKCETRYLMGESKPASSKSSVRRGLPKSASTKQVPETESQRREKMLERIIEHKDKRIFALTKEIQRLNSVEKELSNKVFRLSKLLPMSHMSTEIVTECLLKEIQSLELQLQRYQEKYDKLSADVGGKSKRSNLFDSRSRTALDEVDLNVRSYNSSSKKVNNDIGVSSVQKNIGSNSENIEKEGGGSMVSKLHLLYNDVIELKRLFASENEKFFLNLSKESLRNDMMRTQWEEVMERLNEIAEGIQSLLRNKSNDDRDKSPTSNDKENIILCLQDRLKDALELTTQYETENSELKASIQNLKGQLQKDQLNNQSSQTDVRLSPQRNSTSKTSQSADAQHLRELLAEKQKQLESVESHLKTYRNFVEQLQGFSKDSLPSNLHENSSKNDSIQSQNSRSGTNIKNSERNFARKEVSAELKLEVAERNIKTLEDAVENLQKVIQSLQQDNQRLVSEVSLSKTRSSEDVLKLRKSEEELVKVQMSRKDLENRVQALEQQNLSLQEANRSLEQQRIEAADQHANLQSRLESSEKRFASMEDNLAHAQNAVEELKEENVELRSKLQTSESMKSLESLTQKDQVMKLKNELTLKDNEMKKVKESLHAIELKALEMSYHRKSLRQAIEKLCDVLVEKADPNKSTENRNAIYKIAVLQSAKALLQLDEDYSKEAGAKSSGAAFDEMSQQVSVYLTEVARIHELLTIKNQQRDDLLKEFLDENAQLSRLSAAHSREHPSGVGLLPASGAESSSASSSESSRHRSSRKGGKSSDGNASTSSQSSKSKEKQGSLSESSSSSASESSGHTSRRKTKHTAEQQGTEMHHSLSQEGLSRPRGPYKPSNAQSPTTVDLLSRCAQLEDLLEKVRHDHQLSKSEADALKRQVADLQGQLSTKSKLSSLLESLIELLRSKECTSEIVVEKLKNDIKWLMAENEKLFDRSERTNTELCRHKEANARMRRDLDELKRDGANEVYVARVSQELKHLQEQILVSAANMVDDS